MRSGLNWPYDSRATDETWRLFAALDPSEITISNHEPDADYERLLELYPGDRLLWHIKLKGNRAWWPQDVYSAEWGNERSLVSRCEWLTARGVVPYVILGNEPDIELAAEPVDNDGNRAHAADTYLRWCGRAITELRATFGDQVKIALAPLSQGNPDRFAYWTRRYIDSGLLGQVDFIAEHCYMPEGTAADDPDWGGRWSVWERFGKPIHMTEFNLNG